MPLPSPFATLRDLQAASRRIVNGLPAVRWLSVPQLVRTAIEVLQASSFAKYSDKREAMASTPHEVYVLPAPDRSSNAVWVDYVADTGDGFDATFATARCLTGGAAGRITTGPDSDVPAEFDGRPRQADLLVLGGDEVYPVASALAYELRLNEVLRVASTLDKVLDAPPVVALPGNHDWYDGLAAFRRNFCESWVLRTRRNAPAAREPISVPPMEDRDDVGGWGAFQSRSYFAVRLSPRWWLWGIDGQLDAPIDAEQLAYFLDAKELLGDAKLILCTASPSWLEAGGNGIHAATPDTPLYTLLWFVDRVLGPGDRHRIRLVLTGDEHHYAHYSRAADAHHIGDQNAVGDDGEPAELFSPELVTCGGGGAFLASTHHLDGGLTFALQPWPSGSGDVVEYERRTCYPDPARSAALGASQFLAAGWRNGPSLPLVLGAADFVLFLTVVLHRPWTWTWSWQFWAATIVVGVLLGFYAAAGAKGHRPGTGRNAAIALLLLGHTAAHVGVAALTAWFVPWFLSDPVIERPPWYGLLLAAVLLVVLGTAVFATYLRVADLFGYHTLEAFSGLRIEGFKSHLRLRVTDDHITVHVIGMETVPAARRVADLTDVVPSPHLVETLSVPWEAPRDRRLQTSQEAAARKPQDA